MKVCWLWQSGNGRGGKSLYDRVAKSCPAYARLPFFDIFLLTAVWHWQ
jgi:hypothetical protein